VTRNEALQRAGRVGRLAPGVWFPTYTKETFEGLVPEAPPSIRTADPTMSFLSLIIMHTGATLEPIKTPDNGAHPSSVSGAFMSDPRHDKWRRVSTERPFEMARLGLMDSPPMMTIQRSMERLYHLGFIDHNYSPTMLGVVANKFRKMRSEQVRAILATYHTEGAPTWDMITICAYIAVGGDRALGINRRRWVASELGSARAADEYVYRLLVADENVEYLLIHEEFMEAMRRAMRRKTRGGISMAYLQSWCEERGLSYDGIMAAVGMRDEIISAMLDAGLNVHHGRADTGLLAALRHDLGAGLVRARALKSCLVEGFRLNLIRLNEKYGNYVVKRTHARCDADTRILQDSPPAPRVITAYYTQMTLRSGPDGRYRFGIAGVGSV